ncbi:MAG: hypothetical protein Q9171_002667 [Xanthocarpia ochracea]
MRISLIPVLLLATLTLSSVIPSKFISDHGGLIKRLSGGQCKAVRVKQGICPREAGPQGSVSLDTSHTPVTECFRNTVCCGAGCNGLNIVGPATSGPKRDMMSKQPDTTVMEKPNMRPLVKRQEPAPQAGEQVTIYQNGELLDPEYAGLFNCKLADASPPTPPSPPPTAPSVVRETIFDIGYFQTEEPGQLQGTVIFRFEAAVFAGNAVVDERIACNNRPTYRDAEFTIGGRPGFPQQIKFDSSGRKGCEFNRGGDSDAGGLTCDGVLAKCSKEDGDPEPIKCKDEGGKTTETWRTQITCIF